MARDGSTLTDRQKKWFKSVREGLVRDTGRSLDDWAAIAKGATTGTRRQREKWLKDAYGIGVNRAGAILEHAFPGGLGWDDPDALLAALWREPAQRAIYDAVAAKAGRLEGVTVGPRKGYVAFSRKVQFAAIAPVKGGARLGLALAPDASPRLTPRRKSESWSERLKSAVMLASAKEVDGDVARLLKAAWAEA
jgi:hypothetical protein